MNRCSNPEHPHCTVWVMPGATVCAHGHAQPAAAAPPAAAADGRLGSSFDMISRLRAGRAPDRHARPPGPGRPARTWVCTLVLLVPRPDASLGEIHQTFLSTHKNVRIHADDASIARLHGLDGAGPLDIDIQATNASIAQLDLARLAPAARRIDVALPTIAWDEDLIEID